MANNMPKLPSMTSSKPRTACLCGCGALVARSFAPGHDATLAAWVKRVLRGVVTLDWLAGEHAGLAAAVRREIAARSLAHIKWDEFPPAADEKVG